MKKKLKQSKNQQGKRKVKAKSDSKTSGHVVRGKDQRKAAIASHEKSAMAHR